MRSCRSAIIAVLSCGTLGGALAIAGMEADAVQSDRGAVTLPGRIEAYPPGRWRLQSPVELGRVVLWVSHLLIRHQGSASEVPFGPPRWVLPSPPPERTREEALQLGLKVAARAAGAPAEFAQLVLALPEDPVFKHSLGSLGGIVAAEFIAHPQILDALAQRSLVV